MGDQHDDIMQDIEESDAPEHLTQVHELASLRVLEPDEANAEDSQNSTRKLNERRANMLACIQQGPVCLNHLTQSMSITIRTLSSCCRSLSEDVEVMRCAMKSFVSFAWVSRAFIPTNLHISQRGGRLGPST